MFDSDDEGQSKRVSTSRTPISSWSKAVPAPGSPSLASVGTYETRATTHTHTHTHTVTHLRACLRDICFFGGLACCCNAESFGSCTSYDCIFMHAGRGSQSELPFLEGATDADIIASCKVEAVSYSSTARGQLKCEVQVHTSGIPVRVL